MELYMTHEENVLEWNVLTFWSICYMYVELITLIELSKKKKKL